MLAVLLLVGAPAFAQTVPGGIDVWTTPDDGNTKITRFVGNPLPAGYFCNGSPAFSQEIKLKGKPIATSDNGLGSTDTIVQRSTATYVAGVATADITLKALSFEEHAPLAIQCADGVHNFKLRVTLDQHVPVPTTQMNIHSDGSGTGGTFDATVTVPGQLVFTDTTMGTTFAPLYDTVNLQASGASWASSVGTGGVNHPGSVTVDSNGDGTPDLALPGTSSGFHTGWSNHCNPPCPVVIQHQGPHPTWPVPPPPPCPRTVVQAANRELAASKGELSGSASAATSVREYTDSATVVSLTADKVGTTTPIEACKFTQADGTLTVVGNAVASETSASADTVKHE